MAKSCELLVLLSRLETQSLLLPTAITPRLVLSLGFGSSFAVWEVSCACTAAASSCRTA